MPMIAPRTLWMLTLAAGLTAAGPAVLADVPVVASIKPVHSLVSGVMQGVGEPHLIVKGDASPHAYSLKPSDAGALQEAGIVFWIGPALEPFLEKPLHTLSPAARHVALAGGTDMIRLRVREGGPFETHDTDADDDHSDGEYDLHVWLDPLNAVAMVDEIEQALVAVDPANASAYRTNAEILRKRIRMLQSDLAATLAPVRNRPFIVFHDAFHYFENRFGLTAAGSIIVNPQAMPGAKRLSEIQARIRQLGPVCVFAEPQFNPRLIDIAIDGTEARSAILDPVGAGLPDGPELYFDLMRKLAGSIRDCLSASD